MECEILIDKIMNFENNEYFPHNNFKEIKH